MNEPRLNDSVKELHEDLARKYKHHAADVEEAWNSFDKAQRLKCVKAGAAEGVVLRHANDYSLGIVHKITPEWNLRDLAELGPAHLLGILKHRATTPLFDQYCAGADGAPGDHLHISEMMRTRGLRHADEFKDCHTFFMEDRYGQSITIKSHHAEVLAAFAPAINAKLLVPQEMGELILQRQYYLLQLLNIIIEDILDEGAQNRHRKERPKKSDKAATDALSKLSIYAAAAKAKAKLTLPELVATARDQLASLEEFLDLLSTEPVVLAHAISVMFFTRPDLLADEKGRRLPVHTDKYISPSVFEAVHAAIKGATIWDYLCRLLSLLEGSSATDKVYRGLLLQEISNVCHAEFIRAQALFKRHVQSGRGLKWFKRVSNTYDSLGNARVTMKGNPVDLTRADPQLHYMLRLCQPDMTASKAVDWMRKLTDLHAAHPAEVDRLDEREVDSLADLAVVVGFAHELPQAICLRPHSRKKGLMFVSKSEELEIELNQVKKHIDLRDFVVPIDNLLVPGKAESALKLLDQLIVEKVGTKMGFLYQDLVEDCLRNLDDQHRQLMAKTGQQAQKNQMQKAASTPVPMPLEERAEERRQKEKTRPSHSSAYEIASRAEADAAAEDAVPANPPPHFRVNASTAQVFSTLFAKSLARGSVSWAAFQGALGGLGFSVLPKFGSVYTFLPPESMAANKSFTVHRPHKSRIEGYMIPVVARRLKRVYGWGESTFEVA